MRKTILCLAIAALFAACGAAQKGEYISFSVDGTNCVWTKGPADLAAGTACAKLRQYTGEKGLEMATLELVAFPETVAKGKIWMSGIKIGFPEGKPGEWAGTKHPDSVMLKFNGTTYTGRPVVVFSSAKDVATPVEGTFAGPFTNGSQPSKVIQVTDGKIKLKMVRDDSF